MVDETAPWSVWSGLKAATETQHHIITLHLAYLTVDALHDWLLLSFAPSVFPRSAMIIHK
jgi:hypothetical protein